jgi:hypothetical protein
MRRWHLRRRFQQRLRHSRVSPPSAPTGVGRGFRPAPPHSPPHITPRQQSTASTVMSDHRCHTCKTPDSAHQGCNLPNDTCPKTDAMAGGSIRQRQEGGRTPKTPHIEVAIVPPGAGPGHGTWSSHRQRGPGQSSHAGTTVPRPQARSTGTSSRGAREGDDPRPRGEERRRTHAKLGRGRLGCGGQRRRSSASTT